MEGEAGRAGPSALLSGRALCRAQPVRARRVRKTPSPGPSEKLSTGPIFHRKIAARPLVGLKRGLLSPLGTQKSPPCPPEWPQESEAFHSESEFWPLWHFSFSGGVFVFLFVF